MSGVAVSADHLSSAEADEQGAIGENSKNFLHERGSSGQPKLLEGMRFKMDEQYLTFLRSLDWEDIAAKTLAAASVFAGRYGWKANSVLPNGTSLEDVVAEAIQDIWAVPSRINAKVPLTVQLKGIVRSKLWNLAKSSDEQLRQEIVLEDAEAIPDDGVNQVDTHDEFARAIDLLLAHPKVMDHSDLELVVMALSCGASTADEISKETSLSINRVYQLTRELRGIYPSIAHRLQHEGHAS
jgi:hypothetical protein